MPASGGGLQASSASGEREGVSFMWGVSLGGSLLFFAAGVLSDSPSHPSPLSSWLGQPEQCPQAYFFVHGAFQPFHPIPCPLCPETAVGT